jgi:hypothetical protein
MLRAIDVADDHCQPASAGRGRAAGTDGQIPDHGLSIPRADAGRPDELPDHAGGDGVLDEANANCRYLTRPGTLPWIVSPGPSRAISTISGVEQHTFGTPAHQRQLTGLDLHERFISLDHACPGTWPGRPAHLDAWCGNDRRLGADEPGNACAGQARQRAGQQSTGHGQSAGQKDPGLVWLGDWTLPSLYMLRDRLESLSVFIPSKTDLFGSGLVQRPAQRPRSRYGHGQAL